MQFAQENMILLGTGVFNILLGLFVFLTGEKTKDNKIFTALTVNLALWAWVLIITRTIIDPKLALMANRLLYGVVVLIPYIFFAFALNFASSRNWSKILGWLFLPPLVLFLIIIFTDFIIKGVTFLPYQNIPEFGPAYNIFVSYLLIYFGAGLIVIAKRLIKTSPGSLERIKLGFIFIGSIVPITTSIIFGVVFLSFLQNPAYRIWAPSSTIFMVTLFTYAILKQSLFNVKIVATELLTFAIWIFLFIRLLADQTLQARLMEGGLLALVIFFGILLIRSVIKEVEQREKLETLSRDLAAANEELKQLDAVKSEFISIASHQLRTPLTVIKGYVSLILENTLGPISDAGRGALDKVMQSAHQLIKLVDDLLNLSRIESGKIQYSFQINNFTEIVRHVIDELNNKAKEKSITVKLENKIPNLKPFLFDHDKMHEVIMNMIDNAIKYSPLRGIITITLEETEHNAKPYVRFSAKDQGIGIRPEDQKRLFNKFSRSEEARIQDPNGMGIGLYFVKRVIEDHGGRVGLLSEGLGKGSIFWVEVPERV